MLAAVIPMKQLIFSKSRLSKVLSPNERKELALFMLKRMLSVLTSSKDISKVFIISNDIYIKNWLGKNFKDVDFLFENCDLNEAAIISSQKLVEQNYDSMLFCLGDLPFLNQTDLKAAINQNKQNSITLFPDRHNKGTNALLVSPPDLMKRFYFGPNSLSVYLANAKQEGIKIKALKLESFSIDVDNPQDLLILKSSNLFNKGQMSLNYIEKPQEVS